MRQPDTAMSDIPALCEACSVRRTGMCAVLSATDLSALAGSARNSHHAPGEIVIAADAKLGSYANLTDGIVKLSRVLQNGRQQLLGLQFPSELIGRLFKLTSPVTVEAASAVDVCRVPREVLESLVASNPDLRRWLLDRSLQDLDDARDWIVTLGSKDAPQRVASLLLLLSKRCGAAHTDGGIEFQLPLTRSDMADFLGLTIETVSRQISKLRREGVIAVTGLRHVTVPDVGLLTARAG